MNKKVSVFIFVGLMIASGTVVAKGNGQDGTDGKLFSEGKIVTCASSGESTYVPKKIHVGREDFLSCVWGGGVSRNGGSSN